jgi:hypothetical protein
VQRPRYRDEREGDPRGHRVHVPVVEPHQLGGFQIVADRAEGPSQRSPIEEELQRHRQGDGYGEDQDGEHSGRDAEGDRNARGAERTRLDGARIRRIDLLEQVLDHDREPEGDDERRQRILPQRPVEHRALEPVAGHESDRQQDGERGPGREPGGKPGREAERGSGEGAQDDEVAVRRIGEAHHSEEQRLPEREERVHPSEEDSLHDGIEEGRHGG